MYNKAIKNARKLRGLVPRGPRSALYFRVSALRAGVVSHPKEWPFGGYGEIQKPCRKSVLIAYQKLAEQAGFATYGHFKKIIKSW